MSALLTVQEALASMKLSEGLMNYLLDRRAEWQMFGKMNSHLYRRILMKAYEAANLNEEQRLMVHFFAAVIKNRDRVLKAMEVMEAEDKSKTWYAPVLNFINTRTTQYVSDVTKSKKFPFVNIPNCNPGLDILLYCVIVPPNERSLVELARRTTFSQLDLDGEMQDIAKEGYTYYWDNVVRGTKNPDAKLPGSTLEVPKFREEYYANSVSDDYKLVTVSLDEVQCKETGYDLKDIVDYLRSVDTKAEYNPDEAVLEDELLEMSAKDLMLRKVTEE